MVALGMVASGARTAHAQTVRGRVIDDAAGKPTTGALVTLVTSDDRRLAPTLTGEDGAYVVRAPLAGTYRVRVDLIGYETWESKPLPLGTADTSTLDVRLPLKRVELAKVLVEDASPCEARPEQAPKLLAVWEEIRRALTLDVVSERSGLVPLDLTLRTEGRVGAAVSRRDARTLRAAGARPWRTRSAADLARAGWVKVVNGALEFSGPDAPTLLAREFVDTHCFRPVRKRSLTSASIGLAFEPAPGRTTSDIAGTIWLDEKSSELRRVEFRFVNLPPDPPVQLTQTYRSNGIAPSTERDSTRDAHGVLEFARLPNGAWYVRKWEIEREGKVSRFATSDLAAGDAVPAREKKGDLAPATLRGTVFDSTTGDGLADATITVPGVPSIGTDANGRFAITVSNVPAKPLEFVVRVEHPRLARFGIDADERRVQLAAGVTTSLAAAVPSTRTLLATVCGATGDTRSLGILLGRAARADGSALPTGARVVAEWPSDEKGGEGIASRMMQRGATIGDDGTFRLCAVPVGRSLQVFVEIEGKRGAASEVVLPGGGVGEVELTGAP